jgi:hypothetical protein
MTRKMRTGITMPLQVITVVILFMCCILFASCEKIRGEGPTVTQERTVQPFHAISAGISGRINYSVSPTYKVELQAQQNILDIIETIVSSGELIIKFRNGVNVRSHENIVVNISGPSPDAISLSGDASLRVSGNVSADRLQLRVSGSGDIEVDQVSVSDKLEATITGSGNIDVLQGAAKQVNLRISGSGNIRSTGVAAEQAEAEISGSGNIRVKVSDKLNARISGSGSIYYIGSPQITTNVSGSGNVRPL